MPRKRETDTSDSAKDVQDALCRAWPPKDWRNLDVAIGFSGGSDSMALLRAILALKSQYNGTGRLVAFHVNHRLRKTESEEDETWCREQCGTLGVPITVLHGAVLERSESEGDGIEAAARKERYELMAEAAECSGIRYLAVAHTQDDQVETVLFRLLRGTGLQGLSGIPHLRQLTPALTLIRPLLTCTRRILQAYLQTIDQPYRTDSSNRDLQLTRNRIRHSLLPKLRGEYNQDVDTALLRLAAQSHEAQQMIEKLAREVLGASLIRDGTQGCNSSRIAFDLALLGQQESTVVCEALRQAWRDSGLSEQAMTYDWWRSLADLTKCHDQSQVLNLPGNVRASIAEGQLLLQW